MDRLTSMSVFVKVVAHRSFAGAAQELGLSRAGVSKHVLALEQSLGARLLNRNTRRLSLTEVLAVSGLDHLQPGSRFAGRDRSSGRSQEPVARIA